MGTKAFLIGIIGGLGLGLLIGSELSGSYITIVGAVLLAFTILFIFIAVFILKNGKLETDPDLDKEPSDIQERSYDEHRRESKKDENKQDISPKQRNRFRFIKK
jgi:hypothetical protein